MDMSKKMFSIGEMARMKGMTVKALRFYEKIGLLKPSYTNPLTKYRYYTYDQFIQLDIIKAARIMDISPKDIKTILDKKDNKLLLDFLEKQKQKAQDKIAELKHMTNRIEAAQDTLKQGMISATQHDLQIKDIKERTILTREIDDALDEEQILLEYAKLNEQIESHHLVNTYETGILYTPNVQLEFHPTAIFNTILSDADSLNSDYMTIPQGRYLCLCFNKDNAQEQIHMFNTYLAENEISPKVILQVDVLNNVFSSEPLQEMQVLLDN